MVKSDFFFHPLGRSFGLSALRRYVHLSLLDSKLLLRRECVYLTTSRQPGGI